MLQDVWQRSWGEGGQLAAVDRLTEDRVPAAVREHRARRLAAWRRAEHDTRTGGRDRPEEKLDDKLAILRKGAEDGALDLLTAFYFKREGADDTFELTHKSFGEYFAALRLLV